MNDLKQIEKELFNASPGTVVEISGYHDSAGDVYDLAVELLPREAYAEMQERDLKRLEGADIEKLFGDGTGDLLLADLITARSQMVESYRKSTTARADGSAVHRGAEYLDVGGSLARTPGDDAALYLMRTRAIGTVRDPKPAKGAIPRAKQQISKKLRLEVGKYIHTLKLAAGKFDELRVAIKIVTPSVPT